MIYHFDFGAPASAVSLYASITSFNIDPSHYGSSSLWGSTDGANWQLVLDNPSPNGQPGLTQTYDQNLPAQFLGSSSFWLQVQMRAHGGTSDYTLAQFTRKLSSPPPGDLFHIEATLIPEPNTLAFLALGMILIGCSARRQRHDSGATPS